MGSGKLNGSSSHAKEGLALKDLLQSGTTEEQLQEYMEGLKQTLAKYKENCHQLTKAPSESMLVKRK